MIFAEYGTQKKWNKKYHYSEYNFNHREVERLVWLLHCSKLEVLKVSLHCRKQAKERHIKLPSLDDLLLKGSVFEYKKRGGKISTLAIRMPQKKSKSDVIVVLSPSVRNNRMCVTYVTSYLNDHNDVHINLNRSLYERR